MELGGLWWTNVLNLVLPPQRHRLDTWPEHPDSVSHMAQKKREKERKKKGKKERKKERKRKKERERERERKKERKKREKERIKVIKIKN